jgi:hypothetical protein
MIGGVASLPMTLARSRNDRISRPAQAADCAPSLATRILRAAWKADPVSAIQFHPTTSARTTTRLLRSTGYWVLRGHTRGHPTTRWRRRAPCPLRMITNWTLRCRHQLLCYPRLVCLEYYSIVRIADTTAGILSCSRPEPAAHVTDSIRPFLPQLRHNAGSRSQHADRSPRPAPGSRP